MAALSYGTAKRVLPLYEPAHRQRGKFTFVIYLRYAIRRPPRFTGVLRFSASFRSMLTLRARSIMAGDLSARVS